MGGIVQNKTMSQSLASPSVTFIVSFFAVFWGTPFAHKKRNSMASMARSEGLLRKMTLVVSLCCACGL